MMYIGLLIQSKTYVQNAVRAGAMLTTGSRYFQRGAVSLCRSKNCKVMVCQTLRMIKIVQDSNLGCTCLV